jgi:hypothetical protein
MSAEFPMMQIFVDLFLILKNTPQLAATGIKGIRIQLSLGPAQPVSIFMRRRTPATSCAGAPPPFDRFYVHCFPSLLDSPPTFRLDLLLGYR